jgi:hypothetical protein
MIGRIMKQKLKISGLIIIFIWPLLLLGCDQRGIISLAETPSPIYILTQTPTVEQHPTVTPFIVTVSTLLPLQKETEIIKLMQTNENCTGFCFWGIRSGETPFSSAIDILRKFHVVENFNNNQGYQELTDEISFYDGKYYVYYAISNKDGKAEIEEILIRGIGRTDTAPDRWSAFTPRNYIKTNGPPEKILIRMDNDNEGGLLKYDLILKYKSWVVSYYGKISGNLGNIMRACPMANYSYDSFAMVSLKNPVVGRGVEQSLLTGLSDETFINMISEGSQDTCFDLDFQKFVEIINK